MFYVYKKKAPVREFVDDHIREQIQDLEPLDAWNKLKPLSKLGKTLGDLNIEIDKGYLTVSGERKVNDSKNNYHSIETGYGKFSRSFHSSRISSTKYIGWG